MLYAKQCWEWLRKKLNWTYPLPGNLESLLIGWPNGCSFNIYEKLWNRSPSILMWEIWKERNKRVFCESVLSIPSLLNKIEVCITEVMNNHLRRVVKEEGTFTVWDGEMK